MVQNVGAAPLLQVPNLVCYCYTTFCKYWLEWTGSNRRPFDYQSKTLPTELHSNIFKTDKNNLSVPKTDVNYKLLKPSLCMVRVRGLEPPEHGFLDRSLCQFEYTRIFGAIDETRTRDLVLTKDALYQLSYDSLCTDFRQA